MTSTEYQQLVEFLGCQFTEVDRRFTDIDRRFTEVGRRFDEMGGEIAEVKDQVAELRREMLGHFDEIYRRFERLEQESTTRSYRGCAVSRQRSPMNQAGARSSSATSPC